MEMLIDINIHLLGWHKLLEASLGEDGVQLGSEAALRQDGEHHVILDQAFQLPAMER